MSADPAAAIRKTNDAWLTGRVDDLAPLLHPDFVMVYPDFAGRGQGREAILASFRDFCENAEVHEYREHDLQIDVAGDTAVVSFLFQMVYERSGKRYDCTGRDLWVFQRQAGQWVAVWRTMLDMQETEV
jgi:ketosteroid isomerase-like protein